MTRFATHKIVKNNDTKIDMDRYAKTIEYLKTLELDKWYALPYGSLEFIRDIEMRLWLNDGINVAIIDNGIKVITQ